MSMSATNLDVNEQGLLALQFIATEADVMEGVEGISPGLSITSFSGGGIVSINEKRIREVDP